MRALTIAAIALALAINPASGEDGDFDFWVADPGETASDVVTGGDYTRPAPASNADSASQPGGTAPVGGPWSPSAPVAGPWAPAVPEYVAPPPDESDAPLTCLNDIGTVIGPDCASAITEPGPEPEQPEQAEPQPPPAVVTISDIASFAPAPPSVATEPDGVAAKNMPLNTIASAQIQTVGGELFGFPVSVTFTPAGFRQDWGDGTVTESSHGGSAWQSLQQAEFTPTDTSHAYAAKGTYPLTVTALYTAVVDFGPWGARAVDGVISAPGPTREIRVVEVHTALVQHDCTEDPTGPGCPA
jgi:hypothetical protein